MQIGAKIIADSISESGKRIISLNLTMPRFLLPEVLTHRMASRNTASSRAIPLHKRIAAVRERPFTPEFIGMEQPGMSARKEVDPQIKAQFHGIWQKLIDDTIRSVEQFQKLGVHKQISSRPLDTFSYTQQIFTATELSNLFWQRCHPDAQPEFRILAEAMVAAVKSSTPTLLKSGEWHLPYVTPQERAGLPVDIAIECSVARCARVSYENHEKANPEIDKDQSTYGKLVDSKHMSPLQHQCTPVGPEESWGPYKGWKSHRDFIPNEKMVNYPGIIGL